MKNIDSVGMTSRIYPQYKVETLKPSLTQTKYSFKAGEQGVLSKFAIGFFETMNSSMAANFLVLDAFGMIAPRVYQAYTRNSKELGHKNVAAATEEFTRELFTGPSIVLLPIAAAVLFGKWAGKSVNTSKHLLEEYKDILKTIVRDDDFKKTLKERFANLDFKNTTNHELFKKNLQQAVKEKFYDVLIDRVIPQNFIEHSQLIHKMKTAVNHIDEGKINVLEHIVSNHNKLYGSFPERPFHINYPAQALKYKKLPDGPVGTLMSTAKNYADDIVSKVGRNIFHPEVSKIIDHLQQKVTAGRAATTIAGILSVGVALRIIPKYIAHMHKVYPGLYGLGDVEYNQGEAHKNDKTKLLTNKEGQS